MSQNTAVATVSPATGTGMFTVTDTESYAGGAPQQGTTIIVTDGLGNSATLIVGEYTCLP